MCIEMLQNCCLFCVSCQYQALKSVATRSLAESKLDLGANEPKVVEVRKFWYVLNYVFTIFQLVSCRQRNITAPLFVVP